MILLMQTLEIVSRLFALLFVIGMVSFLIYGYMRGNILNQENNQKRRLNREVRKFYSGN